MTYNSTPVGAGWLPYPHRHGPQTQIWWRYVRDNIPCTPSYWAEGRFVSFCPSCGKLLTPERGLAPEEAA